jgi:hypothetical protein
MTPHSQTAYRSLPAAAAPVQSRKPVWDAAERLGKRVIEGIEAEGARSVRTVPVKAHGNNCPADVVSEQWDSPELQVAVMYRVIDPISGREIIHKLTNLTRGELDPSLFTIPPNYKIKDGSEPRN